MQAYGQPSSSVQPPEEDEPDMECHICMDADVEVRSLPCNHRYGQLPACIHPGNLDLEHTRFLRCRH